MRALLVFLVAGCGFERAGANPDLAVPDLASVDGGEADLSARDLAGLDLAERDALPPCAPPQLLIAVAHTSTGAGRVARVSLAPDGGASACATLSGNGGLPAALVAVAPMNGPLVAVAARDELLLLDSRTDAILWRHANPSSLVPVDVFDASALVGVAYADPSDLRIITRVQLRDSSDLPAADRLLDGVDLPISDVRGVSAHPDKPTHFLALQLGATPSAAKDVDPFARTATSQASCCGTQTPLTIAAAKFGGSTHVVWAVHPAGGRASAYYMEDLAGGGLPSGPASCGTTLICDVVHAVPDPTQARGILGLCGGKVRRWDSFGQGCTVVFDGLADGNATRLAIAP